MISFHAGNNYLYNNAGTAQAMLFSKPALIRYILAVFAIAQAPLLLTPPDHVHTFRQALTAGVARNYLDDSADFLKPRVLEREHTDGVTGMEFPIYNYAIYLGYRIFGFHHNLGKILSFVCALMALWFFFRWVSVMLGAAVANLATAALAFSPLFFTFSGKVMPEMAGMMFQVLALWFFTSALFEEDMKGRAVSYTRLAAGVFFFQMASLVKLNTVTAFVFALYLLHRRFGPAFLRRPWFYLAAALAFLPFAWWYYVYVPKLVAINGLTTFFLGFSLVETLRMLVFGKIDFIKALTDTLPGAYLGYGLAALSLYGWYRILRDRAAGAVPSVVTASLAVAMVNFACVVIKAGDKFVEGHTYYLFGSLPYTPVVAGYAVVYLLERPRAAAWRRAEVAVAVIILVSLFGRVGHTYSRDPVPDRFMRLGAIIDQVAPPGERIAVNTPVNPTSLYYFHRTGWLLKEELMLNPNVVSQLHAKGLRYLVFIDYPGTAENRARRNLACERVWVYPGDRLLVVKLKEGVGPAGSKSLPVQ